MITIKIKMKNDDYIDRIDRLFNELAHMNKINKYEYSSNKDVFMSCYNSAEALMKRKWFRDNVLSMKWKVGNGPEEDMVTHFTKTLTRDGYL